MIDRFTVLLRHAAARPKVPVGRFTFHALRHSTVTLFAKFRGWSTSAPRRTAMWYASSCIPWVALLAASWPANVTGPCWLTCRLSWPRPWRGCWYGCGRQETLSGGKGIVLQIVAQVGRTTRRRRPAPEAGRQRDAPRQDRAPAPRRRRTRGCVSCEGRAMTRSWWFDFRRVLATI
jgi:hypothetical protein